MVRKQNTEDSCGCTVVRPKWGTESWFGYRACRLSEKKYVDADAHVLYHHVNIKAIQPLDNANIMRRLKN